MKTSPAKTVYDAGDAFDPTGLVVVARYKYGNSMKSFPVTPVIENGASLAEGQTTVTLSYTDGNVTQKCHVTITVNPPPKSLTGISVSYAPNKLNYTAGDNFDPTGMAVMASYDDNSKVTVTGYTIVNGNSLKFGQDSVEISYTEGGINKKCTQPINVKLKNGFTIMFDANGGSCSPTQVTTNLLGKLDSLPVPSLTGMSFRGWFFADTDNSVGTDTVYTEDTVLQARWYVSNATIAADSPVDGAKVSSCKNWSVTSPVGGYPTISASGVEWYEKGSSVPLADDAVFVGGKTYTLTIKSLGLSDGFYWLPGENSVTVNLFGEDKSYSVLPGQKIDASCDFTIDPVEYDILEGADQTYTLKSGKTLVFRCEGLFDDFTDLEVDGTVVDKENYATATGSTIVTLKSTYLDTLPAGTHQLKFIYKNGASKLVSFAVASPATSPVDPSPKTGDSTNTTLWLVMTVLSATGLAVTVISGKKKYNR